MLASVLLWLHPPLIVVLIFCLFCHGFPCTWQHICLSTQPLLLIVQPPCTLEVYTSVNNRLSFYNCETSILKSCVASANPLAHLDKTDWNIQIVVAWDVFFSPPSPTQPPNPPKYIFKIAKILCQIKCHQALNLM